VSGHPGVYFRIGRDGRRRYEITFVDSTGTRRWRTVDGNLAAAIADRRAVEHRKDRGERIVATRATLNEVADSYLAAQIELRERTRERYTSSLDRHVRPRLGARRIASITEDDVARLIAEMRAGVYFEDEDGRLVRKVRAHPYAGWTVRGVLVALSRVCAFAVRRGYMPVNPVLRLEKGEKPTVGKRPKRVFSRDELKRLLDNALPGYRPILALAAFTGLRQSEVLGLTWACIDFREGYIRVSAQLDAKGNRVPVKTAEANRSVVLAPSVKAMLLEHRLASGQSAQGDFVFTNQAGHPFNQRNVQSRGFDKAAHRAGLNVGQPRKATFHDLRRTFGSLLIAAGSDVVHVCKQMGHADPSITLRVYADEFEARENAERTRDALDLAADGVV
jgi:integrase